VTTGPDWHRRTSTGRYHPLLGTNVEIRVDAMSGDAEEAQRQAEAAEQAAVDEMVRLQAIFTVFDEQSDLCRWRTARTDRVPAELVECLAAAEHWWSLSGGAFHPAAAPLRKRWLAAEVDQRLPTGGELNRLTSDLAALPFQVRRGEVVRTGDCSGVDLNAVAKGYIVDRAVDTAARSPGVVDVLVNAGGDLCHRGDRVLRVGVENPTDLGGPPATVVALAGGAIATSGSVHRGFRIAGDWYGHVLDPRTGWPVADRPSTTVRAPDATTADAVATVVNVLGWAGAGRLLADLPEVAVLSVDSQGLVQRAGGWKDDQQGA
jgi:thiamine biosynthesis lipoprotein